MGRSPFVSHEGLPHSGLRAKLPPPHLRSRWMLTLNPFSLRQFGGQGFLVFSPHHYWPRVMYLGRLGVLDLEDPDSKSARDLGWLARNPSRKCPRERYFSCGQLAPTAHIAHCARLERVYLLNGAGQEVFLIYHPFRKAKQRALAQRTLKLLSASELDQPMSLKEGEIGRPGERFVL
jgi:hypothetical protein